MTNGEWALIEPLLPQPCRLGRPRRVDLRSMVEAILYLLATGRQWPALPKDFAPRSTAQGYFYRWRAAVASVGIIDSQSVATTDSGGPRGLDAAKRIKGRIFAGRVYRGQQLPNALADCGPWTIEIVERPKGVTGFQLLPRRWVGERPFAWIGPCRRHAKDFEAAIASATAWLLIAHLRLLTRRLARP